MRHVYIIAVLISLVGCSEPNHEDYQKQLERLTFEVKQLESNQEALSRELDSVQTLLRRLPTKEPPIRRTRFTPDSSERDDPYLGNPDAPILLMAFTDFSCTPCKKFSESTLPLLQQRYIDRGSVTYLLRDYPLPKNPHSRRAAALAHCAGEQGHYWEMHDALFANTEAVHDERWARVYDTVTGVDTAKLEECLDSGRYLKEIDLDIRMGKALGARGAPGFFLGTKQDDGSYEGVFIRGAQPFALFKAQLDKLLPKENA